MLTLEKLLCSAEDPSPNTSGNCIDPVDYPDVDEFVSRFYTDYPSCRQYVCELYSDCNDEDPEEDEEEDECQTVICARPEEEDKVTIFVCFIFIFILSKITRWITVLIYIQFLYT